MENNDDKKILGRPKGSTDKQPRAHRKDFDLVVNPGDNTKITMFNLKLAQMPKVDTGSREEIEERIMQYFQTCLEEDVKPGVAGLCLALGISRQAWNLWEHGRFRDYSDIVARTKMLMESIMEQYALQGKVNPVTAIFLMKSQFGYIDKSEVVLTPNPSPLGEQTDMEALKQKYLDNTYGVTDDNTAQGLESRYGLDGESE